MQSTEKVSLAENGDKSLNEWPTLNDVCTNAKKTSPSPNAAKNAKNIRSRNKSSAEKSGGYDSSKENEVSFGTSNGRGARKKSSLKTKWVPVPIVPQPYKKRGYGRNSFDLNRNFNADKKNESTEYSNGEENGRNNVRGNNRFRGKRGRGYSNNWRPRREETSRGEVDNETSSELTFDLESFNNSNLFYDPFLHSAYVSALHINELKKAIRLQIEYYFSEDNLVKDIYMRRKMDGQGYVKLTLISTFHRVKNLTKNIDTIIEALKDSSKLELVDDAKVRPVVNPLKWPLTDAFPVLRSDVPEFIPGQPYITTLIEGMGRLNFSDGDQFPQSPDSTCTSPDQGVGDYIMPDINNKQHSLDVPYFSESASPPEHNIGFYAETSTAAIDPYATNMCVEFYPTTPSPDEHVNFDYYSEQINGVTYITRNVNTASEHIPNGDSFYYGSSPEVLSPEDNSLEDHPGVLELIKSPEPTHTL